LVPAEQVVGDILGRIIASLRRIRKVGLRIPIGPS
jgi:hypothetical protein